MLDMITGGIGSVMNLPTLMLILLGVGVGIVFGAIPGLTANMGVALSLPLTFGMEPVQAMSLLMGIYTGGISGGLIAAILLNIPGTPASITTCFDGYPLTQRGEAGRALGVSILASFIGGMIGILLLTFFAPTIAQMAMRFGPHEYFSVSIFALTMLASLSKKSLVKGLLSGVLGIGLSMVGVSPVDAFPRYTFGIRQLYAGFALLPVLIGIYSVSEILKPIKQQNLKTSTDFKIKGFGLSLKEFGGQIVNLIRSSLIGTGIGVLPGIGASTSNIIAYVTAKNNSKHPEKFGTGTIEGLVASESANNAGIGGALIPLLTLGIPGDTVTAMLLGGLMIHGLRPGPLLFVNSGDVVYGIFTALVIANIMMLVMQYFGIKAFVRLLTIPRHILLPIVFVLCVVGAFGANNRIFDAWTLFGFGVLGLVLLAFDFPLPPLVLGFILGPIVETNLRRGLALEEGSFLPFFTKPISAVFLAIAVVSVMISAWKRLRKEPLANSSSTDE